MFSQAVRIIISVISISCLPALALGQRGAEAFSPNPLIRQLQGREEIRDISEPEPEAVEPKRHGVTVDDMFGELDPMFPRDSAATTYAKEVKVGESVIIGEFDEEAGVRAKPTPQATKRASKDPGFVDPKFKNPYPKDKDGILSAFGDPGEDTPLKAVDNAPTPFKAVMASLQAGDEELAFAYARQYVRYIKHMKQQVDSINKMTEAAMTREGLRPPLDSEEEENDEYRAVVEKDLRTVRGNSEDGLYIAEMMPEVKAMLRKAEEAEAAGAPRATPSTSREEMFQTGFESGFDEAKGRMKARQSIAGRVPVDSQGRAQVLVFLAPGESKSLALAREVEILKKRTEREGLVKVSGVVPEEHFERWHEQKIQSAAGLTYPVRGDLNMVSKLGVSKFPSLVVVAPSTGMFILEEGYRPFYYIDELVKAVQGFQVRTKE